MHITSCKKTIASLSNYDQVNQQASILTGDSTVRAVQTQLRGILNSSLQSSVAGELNTLSQVGISFQKDGTLLLDNGKLNASLNDPAKDVSSLFATDGFAVRLDQMIDGMLENNGLIDGRMDGINTSIKDINKQREALGSRLEIVEKRFRTQFTALDTTIASMKQTSEFLAQQLSSLPGANANN
ncbi:flagellar filament capping protein FliD [Nitrosomonas ureae]|uniref:flagellar filament capping protein FliD n=1 Tax=Nitrosomonas ureae TaxID=44577 RepID=UPI000B12F69E|nr:flagellar filament capping protein FliD [Nitrosomonas ureae]